MTKVNINFIYKGNTIRIQCERNDYMKDIIKGYLIKISKDMNDVYFMYNGSKINKELKLNQVNNKDKEINILVNDINDKNTKNKEEVSKQNKNVKCPECGNICLIDFKDYKITLNKCINKHSRENVLLYEYNDLQNNNELNAVCSECNKNKNEAYNNQLYKCCSCKVNLCLSCKTKHNKDHILIDYKFENYLCNAHGKKYISYCEECNTNLCDICKKEHNIFHNYSSLNSLITSKKNNIKELRIKIDYFKKEINDIIYKFNKIVDNLEIYYNINNNIINNYNIKNINYEILMNIKNIYNYNEKVIKDIDEIVNENKIRNKIKYIYNIYYKMMTKNEIIIKYKYEKNKKKKKTK